VRQQLAGAISNGNAPQEPILAEGEKADIQGFLKEILQILPLVGLHAFDFPKAVATPHTSTAPAPQKQPSQEPDTIIVPAHPDNFERVFLGEDCWYAVRISGGMLDKIKYIAAYQAHPIKAITHYAPVDRIEPYGEGGKYKLIFAMKAKPIGPIPYGDAPKSTMMGSRYTTFAQLIAAKKLTDLIRNTS